jgi:hypothetical protein
MNLWILGWMNRCMNEWILHRLWWSRLGESATAWEQQTQQRGKCLRMLRISSWSSSSQRNVQYRGPRGGVWGGGGGGGVCFFFGNRRFKTKVPPSTHDFFSLKSSRHTWERFGNHGRKHTEAAIGGKGEGVHSVLFICLFVCLFVFFFSKFVK